MAGDDALTFRALLKRYRVAAGLSQEALAEQAGLSAHAISDLERGARTVPRRDTVALLSDALQLSAADRVQFDAAVHRRRGPLPSAAPVARALQPRNLPLPLTPLIGRDADVAAVVALLHRPEIRLITLTGPAGVGKTRLSAAVAAALGDAFSSGIAIVALAPLSDPHLVPVAMSQVLGIREVGAQALWESLSAFLRDKQLLLVLDNFEQVIDAAPALTDLLAQCPQVKVLVTSRAALRVRGEHEVAVLPLPTPNPAHLPPVDALAQVPAVALFLDRAQAVTPAFHLSPANAATVAQICVRLDGLPLAIELAAARSKLLPPHALLVRLAHRLPVLVGQARDVPPRQQTLRSAITWSYNLLDQHAQRLFRQLSVFVGGWTLSAAEAVCATDNDVDGDVLTQMDVLLDNSLLTRVDEMGPEPRFGMLETIQEYALEQLAASGEEAALRQRHAIYYRTVAEATASSLHGTEQRAEILRLEMERGNMWAALSWSRDAGDADTGQRLAVGLAWFWFVCRHVAEGRRWLGEMVGLGAASRLDNHDRSRATVHDPPPAPTVHHAQTLFWAGHFVWAMEDIGAARSLFQDSLEISRALADQRCLAYARKGLGQVMWSDGHLAEARAWHEESAALFAACGDTWERAWTLASLGGIAVDEGDDDRAIAVTKQARELFEQIGDPWGVASTLDELGAILMFGGERTKAHQMLDESLILWRELANQDGMATVLLRLATIALLEGNHAQATTLCEEGMALWVLHGQEYHVPHALNIIGLAAFVQRDYVRALSVFEVSYARARELGNRRGMASALSGRANCTHATGDHVQAMVLRQESLSVRRANVAKTGTAYDRIGLAYALRDTGRLALTAGDVSMARALLGECLALWKELGIPQGIAGALDAYAEWAMAAGWLGHSMHLWAAAEALAPKTVARAAWWWGADPRFDLWGAVRAPEERARYAQQVASVRARIGDGTFTATWAAGEGLPPGQAIADAVATTGCG